MAVVRPHGLCRIQRPVGMEPDVKVADSGGTYEVPESHYRMRGYEPPFEQLPWCSESGSRRSD